MSKLLRKSLSSNLRNGLICEYSTANLRKSVGLVQKSAGKQPLSFDKFISLRKAQAKRSILIQVPNRSMCEPLYKYCSGFGAINQMIHFTHAKEYVVLEYEHARSIPSLLACSGHFQNNEKIPAETRVLHTSEASFPRSARFRRLPSMRLTSDVTPELSLDNLFSCRSISEQIREVYNSTKLSDLDVRMKFFVCSVIEDVFSSLFPKCAVTPFGSSVNGFGKHGCDLDMVLVLGPETGAQRDAKLRFMTKKRHTDERVFTQHSLQILADMLQYFVPQCHQVQRIPRARVPILKFMHEASNIECDLCMTNRTGVPMSELLYLFGEYDNRLRPLVFTVRHWARLNELTNKSPGPWISNFMLSMLVMFFLQTRTPAVLPTVNAVISASDITEKRLIDSVDCSFVKDVSKLPASRNETSLEELLVEFFDFYASFDFSSKALSVVKGCTYPKPDFSPMYIENPLEPNLNISKNFTMSELERLQKAAQDAVWKLSGADRTERAWGIMKIFNGAQERTLGVKASDLLSRTANEEPVVAR